MKLEEIQVGKKYFHLVTLSVIDPFTGKKKRQMNEFFVIEIDLPKKRVCASVNLSPAKWFDAKKISKWKDKRPTEIIYKSLKVGR